MAGVEELEMRITAALERIGKGLDGLGPESAGNDAEGEKELTELRAALEDEKLVTAQLEERVKALHEKQEDGAEAVRVENAALSARLDAMDRDLQKLRAANEQLRDSNAKLRAANEKGVGEPHLINKAMLAELDGLRATRAAERQEAEAVLDAMAPLLADAKTGEDA